MPKAVDPFRLLLFAIACWMNHEQQQIIDYLRMESRVLHEPLTRPPRFDDDQLCRLAVRAKAHAERFVRTIKDSCLDRLILLAKVSCEKQSGNSWRTTILEWNHQGLGNQLIAPEINLIDCLGEIRRYRRLGGLLNYYHRAA